MGTIFICRSQQPAPQQQTPEQPKPSAAANAAASGIQPTNSTRERAEGVKQYIESKYAKQKHDDKEKKEAWDKLMLQMDRMQLSSQEKELIK